MGDYRYADSQYSESSESNMYNSKRPYSTFVSYSPSTDNNKVVVLDILILA